MLISLVAILVLLASMRAVLRKRNQGGPTLAAALCAVVLLELFDLGELSGSGAWFPWQRLSLCVEALLPPLWILCSHTYARVDGVKQLRLWDRILLGASLFLIAVPALHSARDFCYAPDFPEERLLFLTDLGYYFYAAITVLLVRALINFESTLVNAAPEALWRVKFDLVALGSMLAVLIFYYSQAVIYRTINMEYVPLRSLLFIVAAAIMAYSRSRWRGPVRVTVSRSVAFKSVTFGVVAGYLLLLGAFGQGMEYFGPRFPRVLTVSLAFLSGIALVVVLLSDRAKREIKVYLHKNFYQSKYDYRAQWLNLTERLANCRSFEELMEKVLNAYCDTFGVKGGALFLHQPGCGWYCAATSQKMEQIAETIPQDNLLICYLRDRRWIFCSKDDNPEIRRQHGPFLDKHRISFVVPLFEGEHFIGFIALGEQVMRDETFRYEDFDLMKTIARQAALAIQHQLLSRELMQAKSLEAVGNLATFVVHDLKNQVATVSLMLENARQHLDNPDFQKDLLVSLENTVQKMQRLIGRLRNLGESEIFNLKEVDLLELARRSAETMGDGITVTGTPQVIQVDEGEIQKVVLNLILNGIEASPGERDIRVEVGCADAPFIRVADRGCGMSPGFLRSELFTPFRTTKKKGLGIGLYQCRQIVEAHGGRIDVTSVEGNGSVFTVWLPPSDIKGGGGAAAA